LQARGGYREQALEVGTNTSFVVPPSRPLQRCGTFGVLGFYAQSANC
jgi:hypothetical protein